jgi:hypothetical protein
VIRYAVWLCFRFALSLRDVEELLAQRRMEHRDLSRLIWGEARCGRINLRRQRPCSCPRLICQRQLKTYPLTAAGQMRVGDKSPSRLHVAGSIPR